MAANAMPSNLRHPSAARAAAPSGTQHVRRSSGTQVHRPRLPAGSDRRAPLLPGKLKAPQTLTLSAAGNTQPHPHKWLSGGDDALFVHHGSRAIGIADGCGAWAHYGVNPARYSRTLMRQAAKAAASLSDDDGALSPANLLATAQSQTKVLGTCTAAAATLTGSALRTLTLGDSGYCLLRNGRVVKRSSPQMHSTDCPYQLGCIELLRERGERADRVKDGKQGSVAVQPGDIVVLGTDGLFDNLRKADIEDTVCGAPGMAVTVALASSGLAHAVHLAHSDAVMHHAGLRLVQQASKRSRRKGGHVDDISCVVAMVMVDNRPTRHRCCTDIHPPSARAICGSSDKP